MIILWVKIYDHKLNITHNKNDIKLDNFTQFLYRDSYDLIRSTSHQFQIDHYIIHLDNFTHFLYEPTKPSPCKL